MGGADDIALEFRFENLSITLLHSGRHRLAHEGESLVTIESAKLDGLPIQFKAMIRKLHLAKTKAAPVFIERRISLLDANHDGVQIRTVEVPAFDCTKVVERQFVQNRLSRGSRRWQCFARGRHDAISVAQLC